MTSWQARTLTHLISITAFVVQLLPLALGNMHLIQSQTIESSTNHFYCHNINSATRNCEDGQCLGQSSWLWRRRGFTFQPSVETKVLKV